MNQRWTLRMRVVIVTAVIGISSDIRAQEAETWVEGPVVPACESSATPTSIQGGDAEGNAGTAGHDVDNDSRVGSTGMSHEDNDSDAVWSTIADAVSSTNLSAGGIAHIFTRHFIREGDIPIDQSLTLRGAKESDVVISNDCASATDAFVLNLGSGEVVVFENLVIRGFEAAINCGGSTSGLVILRNCTIVDCDYGVVTDGTVGVVLENTKIVSGLRGIDAQNGSGTITLRGSTIERMEGQAIVGSESQELRVHDSKLLRNDTAVEAIEDIIMEDSVVSGNATYSVVAGDAFPWVFTRCTISDNGSGLIADRGAALGTANITLDETRIIKNKSDGLFTQHAAARISVTKSVISENDGNGLSITAGNGTTFSIADSQIEANDDDGIHLENSNGCTALAGDGFEGFVMSTRIFANGDDGIDHGGNGSGCDIGSGASAVRTGLLENAIFGNGGYGLEERTSSSTFHCDIGSNILSDNTAGAENGTGGVCTSAGTSYNQVHSN